jgi:hypothetical protein
MYYRLVQLDFNGTKHYSEIRVVEMESSQDVLLYPNPASEQITIEQWKGKIEVMDVRGCIVFQETSNGKINIPCGDFPKGIYLVKLQSGTTIFTRKLILY